LKLQQDLREVLMPTIRPLIAGNWKMNGLNEDLGELRAIASSLSSDLGQGFDALICLPATLLSRAAEILQGENLALGGQDCHYAASGAHTGDISAIMLKDSGADFVILGHSERRVTYQESNALICAKMQAARSSGLQTILCIGESLGEYEAGETMGIIDRQLDESLPAEIDGAGLIIAYEPVWAIGSGKIPSLSEIDKVHQFIRAKMCARFGAVGEQIRLLYGGSVKPDNAARILTLDDVNGALVGGASLKARDFIAICAASR